MVKKYYEILDADIDSSKEEISQNYRQLLSEARRSSNNDLLIARLNIAYSVLMNNIKRNRYDATLKPEEVLRIRKNYELNVKAKNMFRELNRHINKPVRVTFVFRGKEHESIEYILQVEDFSKIHLSKTTLPFINYTVSIKRIESIETGEVLYENNKVAAVKENRTLADITRIKSMSWGTGVAQRHHDIEAINNGMYPQKDHTNTLK